MGDGFSNSFLEFDFDTKSVKRKIFAYFYLPRGGRIILQAQAAKDEAPY